MRRSVVGGLPFSHHFFIAQPDHAGGQHLSRRAITDVAPHARCQDRESARGILLGIAVGAGKAIGARLTRMPAAPPPLMPEAQRSSALPSVP